MANGEDNAGDSNSYGLKGPTDDPAIEALRLRQERFYTAADIHWFNARGEPPQWNGPGRTLDCIVNAQDRAEPALCLLFSAEPEAVEFVS